MLIVVMVEPILWVIKLISRFPQRIEEPDLDPYDDDAGLEDEPDDSQCADEDDIL